MLQIIIEIFVLVTALSVDAFAASFAYGMNRIRIPAASMMIITAISSITLALSLLSGHLLIGLIPHHLTREISFAILFILGLIKLFDHSCSKQADRANKDHDNLLSPMESLSLGAALSIDSIAAGIGAGIVPAYIPLTISACFLVGILAILAGCTLGKAMSVRFDANLCWISGMLLIALAFMKIF